MTSSIVDFVVQNGVLAVFVLMTLESCGIPIPSELVMPVAGALAAGAFGHGSINGVAAVLAGAFGNLAGSLIAYAIAALWGERFLLGPGRYIGIRRHHVELADGLFQRRGPALVFFGRMVPAVRTYISFPAGMARMPLLSFSLLTFAGALLWCAALTYAGYQAGVNYDRINGAIGKVAIVAGVLIVVAVVVWFVRGRREDASEGAA
ncbi:MAG TPA: DedA family protein [Candidatus Dormibacteraeota bacterium]